MGRPAFLVTNGIQDPSNRERLLSLTTDLHGNLIGSTTDSLGADFDVRFDVLDGLRENFNRFGVGDALFQLIKSIVKDFLGNGFFCRPT